jgi:hypothetical protein
LWITATNLAEIANDDTGRPSTHLVTKGTMVFVVTVAGLDGTIYYVFGAGPSAAFPVKLSGSDSGDAGDQSNQCAYSYDVDDFNDNSLATGVDPTDYSDSGDGGYWQRPTVGYCTAATYGLAVYDKGGNLKLTWINEVPDAEACP